MGRLKIVAGIWLALAFIALAGGCASVLDSLLDLEDKAPIDLGSPDSTCILIVACEVKYDPGVCKIGKLLSRAITGAPRAALTSGRAMDTLKNKFEGFPLEYAREGSENLLIFPRLKPGVYRLSNILAQYKLDADERKCHYRVDDDELDTAPAYLEFDFIFEPKYAGDFTFTLDAGECAYLGKLSVVNEDAPPYDRKRYESNVQIDCDKCWIKDNYTLDRANEHEVKAMEKLLSKYKVNPWRESWRSRLVELKAGDKSGG
jgi:hypothetical protein